MQNFSKDELEQAKFQIQSMQNKINKCVPKLKENSAQQTLAKRRLQAFEIAILLIDQQLSK